MQLSGWIIVSSDNIDDPKEPLRCGRCDMYIPHKDGKEWVGITVFHLFTKSWIPNKGYDMSDNVIGKKMYSARWLTDRRADITCDRKLIQPEALMGEVIDVLPEMNLVKVLIRANFDLQLPAAASPSESAGEKNKVIVGQEVIKVKSPTGRSHFDNNEEIKKGNFTKGVVAAVASK